MLLLLERNNPRFLQFKIFSELADRYTYAIPKGSLEALRKTLFDIKRRRPRMIKLKSLRPFSDRSSWAHPLPKSSSTLEGLRFGFFFFGISCFVLLIAVSLVARIWIQVFDQRKKILSCLWFFFFFLGNFAAIDLFSFQFLDQKLQGDLRFETIIFLASYTIATDLLYVLNKDVLLSVLRQKTIYKYLLAPINGLSLGVIITGVIVWSVGHR